MKLNWGNWIAVVYSVFVLFIIAMVYMAFGEKWDLVAENYYEQEIQYQDKINSKGNVSSAGVEPRIYVKGGVLKLEFGGSQTSTVFDKGQIEFFRPSDAAMDVKVSFEEALKDSSSVSVPLQILSKGKYLAKISWTKDEKNYYFEQNLIIP